MQHFEYFKPYEGDRPYIFVSYAHANNDAVLPILSDMHSRGYNIWYDEGIEVGSEWQECIASHLMDAHLMISFISNAYMKSDNCRREMSYAQSKRIKIINVFLEKTDLTPGMELQIGNTFALMKYTFPNDEFFCEKLYGSELLSSEDFHSAAPDAEKTAAAPETDKDAHRKKLDERKREKAARRADRHKKPASPEIVASAEAAVATEAPPKRNTKKILTVSAAIVIAGCIVAALIVGYFTGFLEKLFTPTAEIVELDGSTVASFTNSVLEQAAREYTGISSGDITVSDLKGMTALYICGDSYWLSEPQSGIDSAETSATQATVTDHSGNDKTVSRGSLTDLSELKYFTDLQTLWLQFQGINSLKTLPACSIVNLNISANRLASLDGIGNLPNLKTLIADGNAVTDLGDLNTCLSLLKISLVGSSCSDFSAFKPLTSIQSVSFSNCSGSDIAQVLDHSSLRSVSLSGCDLNSTFFKSFDKESAITYLSLTSCSLASLAGLEDFTALSELHITGCTGIPDWSVLANLPALSAVYCSEAQLDSIQSIADSAGFTLTAE